MCVFAISYECVHVMLYECCDVCACVLYDVVRVRVLCCCVYGALCARVC